VLHKLSDQIRACHERAAEAERRAEAAVDPALKADYSRAAERWISLARNYEFTDRIADFTSTMSGRLREKGAAPDSATNVAPLLQEISTALIQEGEIDALYELILDGAIRIMSADMGSMQVLERDQNELRLLAWRGFHPRSAEFWDRIDLDSAQTSCGVALSQGRRIVVGDIETCDFMAGSADLDHYRLSNIRAVQSTPLVSRSGQLLGMISTHWREPHQPSERPLQAIDVLARQAADLIERTRNEILLRESEERSRGLALIVESSDDAIMSADLEGLFTSWNKGAERIFGYSPREVIGKPFTILVPANRGDEPPEILARIRSGKRVQLYETIGEHKNGSLIDVSMTVSATRNAVGKIVGTAMVARDVTELKRAGVQISLLAREAEHRAKNVLATVQATVHLSQADTADELKLAIQGRIQALANVHGLFVQTRWTGAELHLLVAQELAVYREHGDSRVSIDGPSVMLEPNTAQVIAVTLHELATNAAKYGALSVPNGSICVMWPHADRGQVVLSWTETGGPTARAPTHQGFGTRVMDSVLRALGGEMRLDWRAEGLSAEMVIPVKHTGD
jgi:PAS domain S-box-containing protein